ncbi:hypothetical protein [Paenibacillus sp. 1781tsa1]|uniref:hypothetical protein n=1 Tax=Paenibacillus sp. 1781tsa1 TaxID=2953810 RepID=UPI00209D0741|nr:hypothetical protein [Paenibacillus sp. 1781tsa1]MCP1185037.1 hypothetical protein [Paenibacillus sp. 1781tsa1]
MIFKKKKRHEYEKLRVMVLDPDLGFDVRWMENRMGSLSEIIGSYPLGSSIKGTNLSAQSVPAAASEDKRPNITVGDRQLTGIVVIMANDGDWSGGTSKNISMSTDDVKFILNTYDLK